MPTVRKALAMVDPTAPRALSQVVPSRSAFLAMVVPTFTLSLIAGLVITAPVAASTAGSVTLANVAAQVVTIGAPASVSTAGSVSIAVVAGENVIITAPASTSTAGDITVANAAPQAVNATAPASISTAGSVTLGADAQEVAVTAPASVSTSGSVVVANAAAQTLTATAPATVSTTGSVIVANAAAQAISITAAASVSTSGDVAVANEAGGNGLLTGLLVYWAMDEASGTRLDSHTGGFSATEQSGTLNSGTGVIGDAIVFPGGSGNYLNTTFQPPAGGPITFNLWYKHNGGVSLRLFGWNNEALVRHIDGTHGNEIEFILNSLTGTADRLATTAAVVKDGNYHMLSFTWSSPNGLRIHIDGTQVAELATSGNWGGGLGTRRLIGDWIPSSTGIPCNGNMDEFGIWNRDLSGADITALYNAGNGLAYGNFTA